MRAVQIFSFLSLCSVIYGSDSNRNYEYGFKPIQEGQKIHLDEAKIFLNAPKILLDIPKIHVQDSNHASLLEDEPINLENKRPLYLRKALQGIPVLIKSGYGEEDLDVEAPVKAVRVVQRPSVIHQQAILIRRPVVVTRDLIATQDHPEKAQYDQLKYGNAGLAHDLSGLRALQAIPVSKGLVERTLVYENLRNGPSHGAHPVSAYNVPLLIQPKAIAGQSAIRYGTGKEIYSSENLKNY